MPEELLREITKKDGPKLGHFTLGSSPNPKRPGVFLYYEPRARILRSALSQYDTSEKAADRLQTHIVGRKLTGHLEIKLFSTAGGTELKANEPVYVAIGARSDEGRDLVNVLIRQLRRKGIAKLDRTASHLIAMGLRRT